MAKNLAFAIVVDDKGTPKIKEFNRTLDDSEKKSGTFGTALSGAMGKVGSFASAVAGAALKVAAMATAFAGFAIGVGIKQSIEKFAEFETALVRIGNVSNENLETVKNKIMELPAHYGSATEMAQGYYQVLSAGVKEPKAAMDLLITASKMAKESHIEQGEAVKGLAALMNAYNKEADEGGIIQKKLIMEMQNGAMVFSQVAVETKRVATETTAAADAADLLYTIERLGITTVGELIPHIGNLANLARAAGLSSKELGAALAQVTATGAGTSESVTQLQSLLTNLNRGFERLPPSIKEFGSASAAIKALGFQGVLKEIWTATEGNATALTHMLGRQEAFMALLQLAKKDFGEYRAKLDDVTNSTGAADAAWKRYEQTLHALWEAFKNTVGKQLIMIGEQLAPTIKKVLEQTAAWLEKMRDPITQKFSQILQSILGWIQKIIPTVESAARAFENAFTWMTENAGALGRAVLWVISDINDLVKAVMWAAEKVQRLWGMIKSLGSEKVDVKISASGSTTRPITEKIAEVADDWTSLMNTMEEPIVPQIDIHPARLAIDAMVNYYQSRLSLFGGLYAGITGTGEIAQGYKKIYKDEINRLIKELNRFTTPGQPFWGFASGTGQEGLPYTGMFYGHKGEIVKNPQESEAERRGATGNLNITIAPTFMTGDRNAARNVAAEIKRELTQLGIRWGTA